MTTYELGRQRLIDRVKAMTGQWSPTALSKECLSIAKRLTDLADDLDGGCHAWDHIENEHDKKPLPLIGRDGYPVFEPDVSCSYKATVNHMRALADSAKRASDSLPNSRKRFALPFAAMGLLHLKSWHGVAISPIDVGASIVNELQEICEAANVESNHGELHSEEALRNELRKQWNEFDRHHFPPGIWEIVSGG